MPPTAEILKTLQTVFLATLGGALFAWLGTPLPWTLGALSVTILLTTTRGSFWLPPVVRSLVTPAFGVIVGSAFTAQLLQQLPLWLTAILIMLLFMVCAMLTGALYFRLVLGVNPVTAYCASVPGGLSEVILIGPQLGADSQTVVMVQVMRVVTLLFVVPFSFRLLQPESAPMLDVASVAGQIRFADVGLWVACAIVGAAAGRLLRVPFYLLTGPMICSAIVYISGLANSSVPSQVMIILQLAIGIMAGSRFAGIAAGKAFRTLLASFFWSLLLLAFSVLLALLCHRVTGLGITDLILALVPGGVQEMTLIALLLGADVALVSTLHVLRLIVVAGVVLPGWSLVRRLI